MRKSPPLELTDSNRLSTLEYIESRLQQMEEDRVAGKWIEDKDDIVKRLGYRDYQDYLRKPLWLKKIRPRIMARDDHSCHCCGNYATEIHHHYYSEAVIRGDDDSLLVALCSRCHDKIEFGPHRKHRTIEDKRRTLETIKLRFNSKPK